YSGERCRVSALTTIGTNVHAPLLALRAPRHVGIRCPQREQRGKIFTAAIRPLICIFALAPLTLSGCVTFGQVLSAGANLPAGPVRQIATTWGNQVVFSPDPVHGGTQTPGMAGRLYLFDGRGLPVAGDGSLTIELYDDSPMAQGGEAKLLELWKFDK